MCIASPIRRAGGVSGGTAHSSGDGVSASARSGSSAVCTPCTTGAAGAIGLGGCGAAGAGGVNTGGGVTRGAAKADAVGERNETASSAGAAGT